MLPILVLSYVRVDTLKQTIESILAQPHGDIYVSNDGAPEKYSEAHTTVRLYLDKLLADGLVKDVKFSSENKGTLVGISEGIDWFFSKFEVGIIIEDDLILHPNLLETVELTSSLLKNPKILSIGLHNSVPIKKMRSTEKFYRLSNFVISWGWVTTSLNWHNRVKSFSEINYVKLFLIMVRRIGLSSAMYHLFFYLIGKRQEVIDKRHCNWDDLWQVNCFLKNQKVITYNYNMVENIGFGFGATHTLKKEFEYPKSSFTSTALVDSNQLLETLIPDKKADRYFARNRKVSTLLRAKMKLGSRLQFK